MRRSSANTMKPSRPSQPGSLQREKSATSIDTNVPKSRENEAITPQGSATYDRQPSPRVLQGKITATSLQDAAALDIMRKRMSEALAQKQQHRSGNTPPVSSPKSTVAVGSTTSEGDPNIPSAGPSTLSGTISTDSAGTVRATPLDNISGRIRTPSYPFPRMQSRLERGISQRSGPHHKPFTLLSPTNEPLEVQRSEGTPGCYNTSELSTPVGRDVTDMTLGDDPNHPTPDLYDMVLMLSTEPGIESWWANVTEILTEAYGAERASLALPGDMTDLENVPWGQKATYNVYGSESGESVVFSSNPTSDADARLLERSYDDSDRSQEPRAATARPPLETRHSIAGIIPDRGEPGISLRPGVPTRAVSFMPGHSVQQDVVPSRPRLARQSSTAHSVPKSEQTKESPIIGQHYSASTSSVPRCHVWRSLLPLEAEPDALLVRTGVASLFGKRKPVILTRAYSGEQVSSGKSSSAESDDERTPADSARSERWQSGHSRTTRAGSIRAFDEFEQPEPSPWAQSPSPSPAARPDPDESPFFKQSAAVDEAAFERDPPVYDYGATANQSLNAIGIDMSKTLVHIPLIQPVPSRSVVSAGLRFPVAILSFLSPVTPYPRNLRHSLGNLLPHLASTFSLAQQFSFLQERTRSDSTRRSATFGLGGTFSDEGSEIELLSELSSQLVQEKDRSRNPSLHGSTYSPSEAASKGSITGSVVGTPFLDQFGMNAGNPATPSRLGADMVDSYFLAKRHRGSGVVQTPGAKPSSDSNTESTRKHERSQKSRSSVKKSISQAPSYSEFPSMHASKTSSSQKASNSTSDSDRLDYAYPGMQDSMDLSQQKQFAHRDSMIKIDSEKPLPELISSLMLNAVPLQLFLAKPTTGDLVWTNRKFDAFRSQGEGRVRDPWKNVHSADQGGLIKSWKEALNHGTQFTHYVRVKRFNSDSDFRWFVFRASTLLSNSGRLLYWIGSFLDVHEQYIKSLEASEKEATRSRDAKLRALADAIPQILFEAVEGEGIVSVNQQWHIFAGQTLDEARGLGFARHVHREDLHKCGILSPNYKSQPSRTVSDTVSSISSAKTALPNSPSAQPRSIFTPDSDSLHAMLQQGALVAETDEDGRTSYSTEIRLRSKGGEFRWHLVRLVKVQHELLNSGRASWYGTCTDIEARMSLERDLNQANQKVNREMESKTKFFANMSHEIRTPLNGILGSMPWLVESQLDHDQRRTVDTVQNSANNLRELVDNILDVTKVEAGKMTLLPKWFSVRSLCEEVVDTVSSRAIERGLELNYSLDSDVPTMVKGDPFRVSQVLLNLMGNSVKFTQQGEIYLRCSLHEPHGQTLEPDEAYLLFDVVDTGRGFNETEFERLFKQFGQIEGANQHESGSGLGLFLSKQLVEMHGGELSVKSKAGEGSTFSFFLKVEPPRTQTEAVSPTAPGRPAHRHSISMTASARSNSDSKTPTISASKGVIHTPGLSRYTSSETGSPAILSPAVMSSPVVSPVSSAASIRSNSGTILQTSSMSSFIPTPESGPSQAKVMSYPTRPSIPEITESTVPSFKRSKSDNDGRGLAPDTSRPELYSIVVICPAENARAAIKQHIEHVVPHQIPAHVATLRDIGSFMDLMNGPNSPTFTHIVLDLPASSDIMLFMRQMVNFTVPVLPALVVVTDHYQKRDIQEDFTLLVTSGRKAFLVHKPVKPSVFAMIFDPSQVRKLSKDRAREVAQTSSDDFKRVSNLVKETIGNRSFRVLLVEDSDVNRMVIMRYLKRVGLTTEEARDGQECVDKVTAQPYGYYSLIICDIQMPRKNGYEACTEVRAWETKSGHPPCPIMALTANAMPEERAAAGSAGFTDYLTKPVDFNCLGLMMVTLLDKDAPHVYLRDQPTEEGLPNTRKG